MMAGSEAGLVSAQAARGAPEGPVGNLRERWLRLRDRLAARPDFQRWAARFPLTRPVARARARGLFDLCAGFVYSQVLLAGVRLGLFDLLAEGPMSAAQAAVRLGLGLEETERLLRACVALRLLEARRGGRYGLGALGAPLVGNTALAAMIEHHALVYADLRDPVALLRGASSPTALSAYWPYAVSASPDALAESRVADYSALMSATQPLVCHEVLRAYALDRHRCLLDVGGGEGGFLEAAADRAPDLALMLFDLPAVVARAQARLGARGLGARVRVTGGDFHRDALPAGADLVSLVRVLHDQADGAAVELLRRVHAALPTGGTVLIAEPLSGTPGAERVGDAYFGFYFLAMRRGRTRTCDEVFRMLRSAGFVRPRRVATDVPLQTSVIVAEAGGRA
jgi:demethylspheroidene O-methyltransferase